jgi:phosphate-selective porin OprO/OprP
MLYAEESNNGYAPIIQNKMDPDIYNWNTFDTKWINTRALAMLAVDGSFFRQNKESKMYLGDLTELPVGDIRGVRLGAAGTINFKKPWTYLISGSINSFNRYFDSDTEDRYSLLDCVVGIPLWGKYGRMQIGKMKAPISMERTMGMVFEQVMERPMHLDALLPSRNIGLSFSDMLFANRLRYRVGIYNDWLEKSGLSASEANQQYTGRITTVAYEDKETKRLLHLGVGYRYEDITEGTVQYSVGPEQYFVNNWLDTTVFEAESSNTYSLEMTYLDGPLWLAAEYTSTAVKSEQNGDPTFSGYHVSMNYLITGEHRGYNYRLGVVRRVTPLFGDSDIGVGAVEVSARYSVMDLNDAEIQGGKMDISSLGIVFHPRRDIQFHAQYSRANLYKKNMKLVSNIMESKADIVQFRMVILID